MHTSPLPVDSDTGEVRSSQCGQRRVAQSAPDMDGLHGFRHVVYAHDMRTLLHCLIGYFASWIVVATIGMVSAMYR